jgi:hypothetical protein
MHASMIRLLHALLVLAAIGTLASGCFTFGRTYGPQDWRELRRADRSVAALPVDREGFYDAATCARICSYTGATVERCYPVDLVVPVPSERIVICGYNTGDQERRAVPRADIDAANVDWAGHVDRDSCKRLCAARDRDVTVCDVDEETRAPADDAAFVVCAIRMPGGSDLSFSRASDPNKQGRWMPRR